MGIEDRLEEATTREVDILDLNTATELSIDQLELAEMAIMNDRKEDAKRLITKTRAVLERSLKESKNS